jgi:DNA-binding transcriptional LysR family regulator
MHYTLHQLKVFQTVCRLKSITKASEELHLTQPAVSIQLKKLQEQFDIPLTEVVGRQLYVTEFGHTIEEISSRILAEADQIKNIVEQYKGLLAGKISFSVVSTGKYVLPYFLKSFSEKYPKVDLRIDVTNKSKVLESLANNETDFSLVSVLPQAMALETIELLDNSLCLVSDVARSLPNRQLKPSDLTNLPMIYREKGSATRMAMETYLKKHNIEPTKTMELVSNEAVKQSINAGLGISIIPLIGLKNMLELKSLKVVPLKGLPIITRWFLVYNKGKLLSPAGQALLDHIEENKEQIVEQHFGWVQSYISKG